MTNIPRKIISTLFPTLVDAARYARFIQSRIHALEEKEDAHNIFASALSDADLSIQTQIEVAFLAHFPDVPFFGEEWKSSHNTKYLAANGFKDGQPYLVTLDPIDGTRPYLDGHTTFQVILTVVSREAFEGVIVLFPTREQYVYAVRGKGAFQGTFDTPFEEATPWKVQKELREVYVSDEFVKAVPDLERDFSRVWCSSSYTKDNPISYIHSILNRELLGGALRQAQVIDGAALVFVAQEMGCLVETLDGKPGIPAPGDYPELILPGLIVGETQETVNKLRTAILKHRP